MSNILEVTESAYYPAFIKMCADVTMGRLPIVHFVYNMSFYHITAIVIFVYNVCMLFREREKKKNY